MFCEVICHIFVNSHVRFALFLTLCKELLEYTENCTFEDVPSIMSLSAMLYNLLVHFNSVFSSRDFNRFHAKQKSPGVFIASKLHFFPKLRSLISFVSGVTSRRAIPRRVVTPRAILKLTRIRYDSNSRACSQARSSTDRFSFSVSLTYAGHLSSTSFDHEN